MWWKKVAELMRYGYTPQYLTCLAAAAKVADLHRIYITKLPMFTICKKIV